VTRRRAGNHLRFHVLVNVQSPSPTVTLTPTPTGASTFTGWIGGCNGTGTCNVTMTASTAVTANLTLQHVTLYWSLQRATGAGSVTSVAGQPSLRHRLFREGLWPTAVPRDMTLPNPIRLDILGLERRPATGIEPRPPVTLTAATAVTATFALTRTR